MTQHQPMACRQGWFEGNVGMHEWVQGLQGTFQQAQSQERQAREEHTFQATEESQQTLMGTHVIKALQVAVCTSWCMALPDCVNRLLAFACQVSVPRTNGLQGSCCSVLCCVVLCCAVLCCAVLCCAVLCCAVLCCAVLCCASGLKPAMLSVGAPYAAADAAQLPML